MFKCLNCGLGHLDPRPSPEQLAQLYDQQYFETHCLSGGSPGSETLRWRLSLEDWRLRLFRRVKPPGKVLDVGCGYGYFLAACHEKGYLVHGIEYSGFAVRHAMDELGLPVAIGWLDEIEMPAATFDVITFWHCLEHMQDPRQAVTTVRNWLKAEGLLIIEVPNHEGTDARHLGTGWLGWHLPYHLYHFTPETLKLLLVQQGFSIITSRTFHSETVKAALRRIPVLGFLARDIAKCFSGNTVAVAAQKVDIK